MKNLSTSKIVLSVLLLVGYIGFYMFEVSTSLQILMLGLVLFSFTMIKIQKSDFALMLTVFLIFYNLYNLSFLRPYGYTFPLSIIMVLTVITGCFMFYIGLLIREDETELKNFANLNYYYMFILGLVTLEVFLSMYNWQIDPKNKSIILLIAFYLIWGVVCLRLENVLSWKKVFIYLTLSLAILVMTLLTINKWQILKGV